MRIELSGNDMNVLVKVDKRASHLISILIADGFRPSVKTADEFEVKLKVADADEASIFVSTYGGAIGINSITINKEVA